MPIVINPYAVAAAFSSLTTTYDSGSGTETAPAGATSCRIRIWGGGGGGGKASSTDAAVSGGGGGGGGFSEKTVSVAPGDQINYVVGAGGAGRTDVSTGSGAAGGQSRAGDVTATGGFAGVSMAANGGGAGAALSGGSGGSASGGATNTTGSAGTTVGGDPDGGGDAAGAGGGDGGANIDAYFDTPDWIINGSPTSGVAPGGGGGGGKYSTLGNDINVNGADGAPGRCEFYYY